MRLPAPVVGFRSRASDTSELRAACFFYALWKECVHTAVPVVYLGDIACMQASLYAAPKVYGARVQITASGKMRGKQQAGRKAAAPKSREGREAEGVGGDTREWPH